MEQPSSESYLWNNPHQKVIYGITLIRKLFMEQPSMVLLLHLVCSKSKELKDKYLKGLWQQENYDSQFSYARGRRTLDLLVITIALFRNCKFR
jgi:hypothetical protein